MLKSLAKKYKTISILGMTKNAGKTTFLNWLIAQAPETDLSLAVTSSGRDGEEKDLVTGLPKPRIFLLEGMLVTTAEELLPLCKDKLEILRETEYFSALGRILICRVRAAGNIQVVGPVSANDHRALCRELLSMGADFVLIDGAADRKAMGSPDSADAVIVAAGAALSRIPEKVVDETCHVVDLYRLPVLDETLRKDILGEEVPEEPTLIVKGRREVLPLKTALGAGEIIDRALEKALAELSEQESLYLYLPGALTRSIADAIHKSRLRRTIFLLEDPTKIFMTAIPWKQSVKRGLQVRILRNIEVAAVAVNPWSPEGYTFDPEAFQKIMQDALPAIPVIDVIGEKYEQIKS